MFRVSRCLSVAGVPCVGVSQSLAPAGVRCVGVCSGAVDSIELSVLDGARCAPSADTPPVDCSSRNSAHELGAAQSPPGRRPHPAAAAAGCQTYGAETIGERAGEATDGRGEAVTEMCEEGGSEQFIMMPLTITHSLNENGNYWEVIGR